VGVAIDTISGFVTNSTALTAVTMAGGDSATIRSFSFQGTPAFLDNVFGKQATAGAARIRSPRLHDFVNGLRFASVGTAPRNLIPDELEQTLYPQDPLTIELTSGAADSSQIALQVYYTDLPGIQAQLRLWEDIRGQIESFAGVLVSPTGSATIGTWGPGRAINADQDQFKVNRMYACLGYVTDTAVGCIAVRGSDTGNLRVGGPGTTEDLESRDWFLRNARWAGRPWVPVFNSANRASVLVDLNSNTASPAPNITFTLALLQENVVAFP
jgi:hypothetical protein